MRGVGDRTASASASASGGGFGLEDIVGRICVVQRDF
jgi:hypothetical protein